MNCKVPVCIPITKCLLDFWIVSYSTVELVVRSMRLHFFESWASVNQTTFCQHATVLRGWNFSWSWCSSDTGTLLGRKLSWCYYINALIRQLIENFVGWSGCKSTRNLAKKSTQTTFSQRFFFLEHKIRSIGCKWNRIFKQGRTN